MLVELTVFELVGDRIEWAEVHQVVADYTNSQITASIKATRSLVSHLEVSCEDDRETDKRTGSRTERIR